MEFIAGGGISIVCSLLLWLFLPRGVVLTSADLPYSENGYDPPYDDMDAKGRIWRVKNESPLPVAILKATIRGFETYDDATGEFKEIDVTDTYDEYLILDSYGDPDWRGHIITPGDSILATIGINSHLKIKYRRAGWSGVLERRQIVIFGGL